MAEVDEGLTEYMEMAWSELTRKMDSTQSPSTEMPEGAAASAAAGKTETDTMRLQKEDMALYGFCPARDELYLVVCELCGLLVKPQALQQHIALRHVSGAMFVRPAAVLGLSHPVPGGSRNTSQSSHIGRGIVRKSSKASLTKKPGTAATGRDKSKLLLNNLAVKSERTNVALGPMSCSVSLGDGDVLRTARTENSSVIGNEGSQVNDQVVVCSSTSQSENSSPAIRSLLPTDAPLSINNDDIKAPVVVLSSSSDRPVLMTPPAVAVKTEPLLHRTNISSPSHSDIPPVLGIATDNLSLTTSVATVYVNGIGTVHDSTNVSAADEDCDRHIMPTLVASSSASEQSLLELLSSDIVPAPPPPVLKSVKASPGLGTLSVTAILPRSGSTVTSARTLSVNAQQNISGISHPPSLTGLSSTLASPHLPVVTAVCKPVLSLSKSKRCLPGSQKVVLCKDREYDPNKHCGVWMADIQKPCTRSLTCKSHSRSLRRAVTGRSKQFDVLLQEQRERRGASVNIKSSSVKPFAPNSLTAISLPCSMSLPSATSAATSVPSVVTSSQRSLSAPSPLRIPIVACSPCSTSSLSGPFLSSAVIAPRLRHPVVASPRPAAVFDTTTTPTCIRPIGVVRLNVAETNSTLLSTMTSSTTCSANVNRPTKLSLALKCMPATSAVSEQQAILVSDDDEDDDMGCDQHSVLLPVASSPSGLQNAAVPFLTRHPKPMAVNGFGSWLHGDGCYVFNRSSDLYRSAFMGTVDRHLHPPPYKKLCVEENLVREPAEDTPTRDPYDFASSTSRAAVSSPQATAVSSPLTAVRMPLNSRSVSSIARRVSDPGDNPRPVTTLASEASRPVRTGSVEAAGAKMVMGPRFMGRPATALNGRLINVPLISRTTTPTSSQQQTLYPAVIRMSNRPSGTGQLVATTTTVTSIQTSVNTIAVVPSPAAIIKPISAASIVPNGTVNRMQKTSVSIVPRSTCAEPNRRSVATLLSVDGNAQPHHVPTVSQSYGILFAHQLGAAWQIPANNDNVQRVITHLPTVNESICRVITTCSSQQLPVSSPLVADRRPAILSKPFRITVTSGQSVTSPAAILHSKLLPHAADSAIHIHHQRKISHHASAAGGTACSTDSNVLS